MMDPFLAVPVPREVEVLQHGDEVAMRVAGEEMSVALAFSPAVARRIASHLIDVASVVEGRKL